MDDRRKALSDAIDLVLIMPAVRRGGNVFDANRVKVKWSKKIYATAGDRGGFWVPESDADWELAVEAWDADMEAVRCQQERSAR